MKNIVHNYSSLSLSAEDMQILAKGLNFAPTPNTQIHQPSIKTAVQQFTSIMINRGYNNPLFNDDWIVEV